MILSLKRICVLSLLVSLAFLTGCPPQRPVKRETNKEPAKIAQTEAPKPAAEKAPTQPVAQQPTKPAPQQPAQPAARPQQQPAPKPEPPKVPPMTPEEEAVKALVERLNGIPRDEEGNEMPIPELTGNERNTYKSSPARAINELAINTDVLELEDVQLIAKLTGLERLSFTDCRDFTDEYTNELLPLKDSLVFLKIGNGQLTNNSAEIISEFTNLVELNLERNSRIQDAACRHLVKLEKLERLNLMYTSLTDTGLLNIRKIPNLQALDIRGCMRIANGGMRNVAMIPNLKSFQHYSNSVTDDGLEALTAAENVESLFLQRFRLTDAAGQSLKKFKRLSSLILFECGEFGSPGLLELKGMPLNRLTLRGLPKLGIDGFEVFRELPTLKRLYLIELGAVGDAAFIPIAELKNLEILEVEVMPGVTDEALKSIAKLQNLRELKIRSTEITNTGLDEILKLPRLTSLQLLDNARIDEDAAKEKFAKKNYRVLTIGKTRGEVQE